MSWSIALTMSKTVVKPVMHWSKVSNCNLLYKLKPYHAMEHHATLTRNHNAKAHSLSQSFKAGVHETVASSLPNHSAAHRMLVCTGHYLGKHYLLVSQCMGKISRPITTLSLQIGLIKTWLTKMFEGVYLSFIHAPASPFLGLPQGDDRD